MSDPNGTPDEDTTADPIEFKRPGWGTPKMKTD
jgi:hypothetical protein